jgi:hypothetical protein
MPHVRGTPAAQGAVCRACRLPFLQPRLSVPVGKRWRVLLRCSSCGATSREILDHAAFGRLDEEIERGREQLIAALALVTEGNMREYADRFAAALEADAILPSDF